MLLHQVLHQVCLRMRQIVRMAAPVRAAGKRRRTQGPDKRHHRPPAPAPIAAQGEAKIGQAPVGRTVTVHVANLDCLQ